MGTFTADPRIEFDTERYVRLRAYDAYTDADRYIYLHRLVAYAHGKIDDLWADLDIHHANGDKWDNRPENLEPMERDRHCFITHA